MSATLQLTRPWRTADWGRSFQIVLDGETVGHIPVLRSTGMPIEAGEHTLQMHVRKILNLVRGRPGRGSQTVAFHVDDGQSVEFVCHPPSYPGALWSFIAAMADEPSGWISLERAHSRREGLAFSAQ
jgi:hypothetical protein